MLSFVGLFFPAMVFFGLGVSLDHLWARVVATGLMVLASFFLGTAATMLMRGYGTSRDFYEWDRAGRPETWTYRQSSQPGRADLVGIVVSSALLAAFFVKIMLG